MSVRKLSSGQFSAKNALCHAKGRGGGRTWTPPPPQLSPTGGEGERSFDRERPSLDKSDQADCFVCRAGKQRAVFAGEKARADGGGHGRRRLYQDAGADFDGLGSP